MLSIEAIEWLKSINYASKSHEERMKLLEAAKIAYPNKEDEPFDALRFCLLMELA